MSMHDHDHQHQGGLTQPWVITVAQYRHSICRHCNSSALSQEVLAAFFLAACRRRSL